MTPSKENPAGWLWAAGAAMVVFAARCREIPGVAGDVPIHDQWIVEGRQILLPWLQGTLSWTAFFAPHDGTIPFWTRLMVWLEAVIIGRWDPQLHYTLNAALFGAVIGSWTAWLRRTLPLAPASVLTFLILALACRPHGWENGLWELHSHLPLGLLFATWHIHGSFAQAPFTPRWWCAQAAGLAAFLAMGGMWTVPVVVLLVSLWTAEADRRRWFAAGALVAVGLALTLGSASPLPGTGAFDFPGWSVPQFFAALLLQLGWPAQWPGAAALLCLPVFLLALRIRGDTRAHPADRTAVAVALWVAGRAVAFTNGLGRDADFASRCGDLLALGVLANAFALARLLQSHRFRQPLLLALALAWLAALGEGLAGIGTRAHKGHALEQAQTRSLPRRQAVREYLATGQPAPLATATARSVLSTDPALVASVLDQPGLRELLPVGVRTEGGRQRGDFPGAAASRLREFWPQLAASGLLLSLLGGWLTRRNPPPVLPTTPDRPADRARLPLLLALTAGSGTLCLLWPMPFEFRPEKRWSRILVPPGVVADLGFQFTTASAYPASRLTGAAALTPEDFRNVFFGTHIDGPGFTGVVQSAPFAIGSPWLVIPVAGFPHSTGTQIRLRIEDAAGRLITEIPCPLPNPANIDFWEADLRAHAGRLARLVLDDGRDGNEGWLAVAPPHPARAPDQALHLRRSWALERANAAQRGLGVVFLVLGVLTLGVWRASGQQAGKASGNSPTGDCSAPTNSSTGASRRKIP